MVFPVVSTGLDTGRAADVRPEHQKPAPMTTVHLDLGLLNRWGMTNFIPTEFGPPRLRCVESTLYQGARVCAMCCGHTYAQAAGLRASGGGNPGHEYVLND